MNTKERFNKVNAHSIRELAGDLGIRIGHRDRGGLKCPSCGKPANFTGNGWKCHRCDASGSAADLIWHHHTGKAPPSNWNTDDLDTLWSLCASLGIIPHTRTLQVRREEHALKVSSRRSSTSERAERIDAGDWLAFWNALSRPALQRTLLTRWAERRGWSAELVEQLVKRPDIARVIPAAPAADVLPSRRWAPLAGRRGAVRGGPDWLARRVMVDERGWFRPWLVLPVYNRDGEPVSFLFRSLAEEAPAKEVGAAGVSRRDLLLMLPHQAAAMRGEATEAPAGLVFEEGGSDWLAVALTRPDLWVSGLWSGSIRQPAKTKAPIIPAVLEALRRVEEAPGATPVYIRTDRDKAGDGYAGDITRAVCTAEPYRPLLRLRSLRVIARHLEDRAACSAADADQLRARASRLRRAAAEIEHRNGKPGEDDGDLIAEGVLGDVLDPDSFTPALAARPREHRPLPLQPWTERPPVMVEALPDHFEKLLRRAVFCTTTAALFIDASGTGGGKTRGVFASPTIHQLAAEALVIFAVPDRVKVLEGVERARRRIAEAGTPVEVLPVTGRGMRDGQVVRPDKAWSPSPIDSCNNPDALAKQREDRHLLDICRDCPVREMCGATGSVPADGMHTGYSGALRILKNRSAGLVITTHAMLPHVVKTAVKAGHQLGLVVIDEAPRLSSADLLKRSLGDRDKSITLEGVRAALSRGGEATAAEATEALGKAILAWMHAVERHNIPPGADGDPHKLHHTPPSKLVEAARCFLAELAVAGREALLQTNLRRSATAVIEALATTPELVCASTSSPHKGAARAAVLSVYPPPLDIPESTPVLSFDATASVETLEAWIGRRATEVSGAPLPLHAGMRGLHITAPLGDTNEARRSRRLPDVLRRAWTEQPLDAPRSLLDEARLVLRARRRSGEEHPRALVVAPKADATACEKTFCRWLAELGFDVRFLHNLGTETRGSDDHKGAALILMVGLHKPNGTAKHGLQRWRAIRRGETPPEEADWDQIKTDALAELVQAHGRARAERSPGKPYLVACVLGEGDPLPSPVARLIEAGQGCRFDIEHGNTITTKWFAALGVNALCPRLFSGDEGPPCEVLDRTEQRPTSRTLRDLGERLAERNGWHRRLDRRRWAWWLPPGLDFEHTRAETLARLGLSDADLDQRDKKPQAGSTTSEITSDPPHVASVLGEDLGQHDKKPHFSASQDNISDRTRPGTSTASQQSGQDLGQRDKKPQAGSTTSEIASDPPHVASVLGEDLGHHDKKPQVGRKPYRDIRSFRLLSKAELADLLNVHPNTIQRHASEGKLTPWRVKLEKQGGRRGGRPKPLYPAPGIDQPLTLLDVFAFVERQHLGEVKAVEAPDGRRWTGAALDAARQRLTEEASQAAGEISAALDEDLVELASDQAPTAGVVLDHGPGAPARKGGSAGSAYRAVAPSSSFSRARMELVAPLPRTTTERIDADNLPSEGRMVVWDRGAGFIAYVGVVIDFKPHPVPRWARVWLDLGKDRPVTVPVSEVRSFTPNDRIVPARTHRWEQCDPCDGYGHIEAVLGEQRECCFCRGRGERYVELDVPEPGEWRCGPAPTDIPQTVPWTGDYVVFGGEVARVVVVDETTGIVFEKKHYTGAALIAWPDGFPEWVPWELLSQPVGDPDRMALLAAPPSTATGSGLGPSEAANTTPSIPSSEADPASHGGGPAQTFCRQRAVMPARLRPARAHVGPARLSRPFHTNPDPAA